jgi:hypothetical protein
MFRWVKKIDALGAVLLAVLVALAVGAVYAALHFGWFRSPWELAGWLFVGGCFIAFGLSTQGASPPPRNPQVHGTAKPASEQEAQAAARGDTKPIFHDQTFSD